MRTMTFCVSQTILIDLNNLSHSAKSRYIPGIYQLFLWENFSCPVSVEGKQKFTLTYRHQTLLHMCTWPRWLVMTSYWWHDSRISLECWECKNIWQVTSSWRHQSMKKGQFLHVCKFFSPILVYSTWYH